MLGIVLLDTFLGVALATVAGVPSAATGETTTTVIDLVMMKLMVLTDGLGVEVQVQVLTGGELGAEVEAGVEAGVRSDDTVAMRIGGMTDILTTMNPMIDHMAILKRLPGLVFALQLHVSNIDACFSELIPLYFLYLELALLLPDWIIWMLYVMVESIRVVRDRISGLSRGFAFVTFPSIDAAGEWVSRHSPSVNIGGSVVGIELKKGAMGSEETDWICNRCNTCNFKRRGKCFRCGSLPTQAMSGDNTRLESTFLINDGSRDIGDIPNPLLLLRGLDSLTTEDTLYRHINGIVPLVGVRLVKDRQTRTSLGFAFAEFSGLDKADCFLGSIYNMMEPRPLVIDGCTISVSYAHMGSFIPVYTASLWVSSVYKDGKIIQVSYWDEQAYAVQYPSVQIPSTIPPITTPQAIPDAQSVCLQPKQVLEGGIDTEPVHDKISTQTSVSNTAQTVGVVEATNEPMAKSFPIAKKLKKASGSNTNSKISIQLEKWQTKQAELKDFDATATDRSSDLITDDVLMMRLPTENAVNEIHSDLAIMACLLCQRQFKSIDDLKKHQAKSALHKTNMQNLREKQLQELGDQLKSEQQSNKKRWKKQQWSQKNSANMIPIQGNKTTVSANTRTEIGEDNIGNRLLQKMGWKAGQGLGADGGGIVAPVEAKAYATGAGIGASVVMSTADLTETLANGRDPNSYGERIRRAARNRLLDE
ncbi:hypothetical protein BDEG_23948 [Batrachochytrium dendrobatidis JEL423]|uniref:G-patch domain-containing protein n=1 Tax=Batrachochytrium dendrobatidis (strain JEL423) TaxID=403673 RepID=A0A177WKH4_BATDL|nr:hypothetical protein BDEG_23948 [Batrachochytrium dendrobatidis JEL423]